MSRGRRLPFDPISEARRQWRARWPAADAMAALTSIMRVQQLLLARIEETLRPFDITFARYEALVLLAFSSRGSLPMSRLGERLMIHPTSVTNIVDRLESQALIKRTPHPSDRRTTLVEITEAGRSVVEEATAALTGMRFGLDMLDAQQVAELHRVLTEVRAGAGDLPAAQQDRPDAGEAPVVRRDRPCAGDPPLARPDGGAR